MTIGLSLSRVWDRSEEKFLSFGNSQTALEQSGIADTPLRIAHFMTQVLHESIALTVQLENLGYSPERLPKVWPSGSNRKDSSSRSSSHKRWKFQRSEVSKGPSLASCPRDKISAEVTTDDPSYAQHTWSGLRGRRGNFPN